MTMKEAFGIFKVENPHIRVDAIHSHIPDIPSYTTELSSSCLLEPEGDLCWFGKYTHNGCGFAAKYSLPDNVKEPLIKSHDSRATWMQWQENNGRMVKMQETGTIEYICPMTPKFMQHSYSKRQQAKKYEEEKMLASTINNRVAVLQMDFAENYTCTR